MKISTQTRYGVRFLLELASHENETEEISRVTTREIAKRQCISEKYLEAIATKLKKGGFILSTKGVNGGYCLARKSSDISIGEVMRLMETTYFETHCTKEFDEKCPNNDNCVLEEVWVLIENSMAELLDGFSIEDAKQSGV